MISQPFALGKYSLLRRVGVGGLAEVYEAKLDGPSGFSKRLAIKLLLPHFAKDKQMVASFIDEATIPQHCPIRTSFQCTILARSTTFFSWRWNTSTAGTCDKYWSN